MDCFCSFLLSLKAGDDVLLDVELVGDPGPITSGPNPSIDSEINLRVPRRPARSSEALGRALSLEVAHSHPLLNFRKPQRHFERAFSLDLAPSCSILGRPGAPRLDFGRQNGLIRVVFQLLHAVGAYIARGLRNTAWAHEF